MRLPVLAMAAATFAALPAAALEPIVVEQGRASILRLSQDADNVIIGNTAYFDVSVEDPRMLILFGRAPGQSNMIVLDSLKNEIMSVPVTVLPPENSITVHHKPSRGANTSVVYSCTGGQCVHTNPEAKPAVAPPTTKDRDR
jgi:Flp pilus assembly secretin CpaC